jgi:uncharacterized protein YbbK (DUF523 family)
MQPSDRSSMNHKPSRLGISACLLGERVRFDGGHKRDPFLVETLGPFVEWVPVCPEVESGMAAPRESLRLVQTGIEIRLITNKTAQDRTASMRGYARRRLEELAESELAGFVLKKGSPTCGLERVKVRNGRDAPEIRTRAVCGRPGDALSQAAGRRGRAAQRPPPARELHRAGICVSTFEESVCVGLVDGGCRQIPHGSQAHAHGPQAGLLSASRPPGGIGQIDGPARISGSLFVGIHGGAQCDRDTAPAGECAAAMLGYFTQTLDRESRTELLGHRGPCDRAVPLVVPLTPSASHPAVRCAPSRDQVHLRHIRSS